MRVRPLIGLDLLKQQLLDQILFFVKETDDSVMMYTVIYGPPGTGKTTEADYQKFIQVLVF